MRLMRVESIREGEKLGRSIFNAKGQVLLGAGVTITNRIKQRFLELGINYVYLFDPSLTDLDIDGIISEKVLTKAYSIMNKVFTEICNPGFNTDNTNLIAKMIIEDILDQKNVRRALINMSIDTDWLFSHAINVCAISVMLGIEYGLKDQALHDLAVGAILHDIGLIQVPIELLTKINKTEDEKKEYDSHCMRGFDILRNKYGISIPAANVAFQHHEYIDGSGYPRGVTGKDIYPLAKIVAVADTYVTYIMAPNNYLPHLASEAVMAMSGIKLDHELVSIFSRKIVIYPNGIPVVLSNGHKGIVVRQNSSPQRPVIREFIAGTDQFIELDLAQRLDLTILQVSL